MILELFVGLLFSFFLVCFVINFSKEIRDIFAPKDERHKFVWTKPEEDFYIHTTTTFTDPRAQSSPLIFETEEEGNIIPEIPVTVEMPPVKPAKKKYNSINLEQYLEFKEFEKDLEKKLLEEDQNTYLELKRKGLETHEIYKKIKEKKKE